VCADDLFNLWIWFEAMVISSYLLVAFYREQPAPLEASVKYLVQSAVGSVFVLFGISLVLAQAGTLTIDEIAIYTEPSEALLVAGALFVIGFGIKSALVPMHTWLPDAYSQSPSGVSAILAGVVTSAGVVTMLRALSAVANVSEAWGAVLMACGLLNIIVGNLLALRQTQVKRLLAYSSLPHIGFMLIGIGISIDTGDPSGVQGAILHLFNHGIMKGLAFLAVGALLYALRQRLSQRGMMSLQDLSGVVHEYPLVSLAMCIAVLGLAGMPPLAGFVSLFRIFGAGMESGEQMIHLVIIVAALNELLALAYYLPLVNTIVLGAPSERVLEGKRLPVAILLPLGVMALAVVVIGVWPELLEWLIEPAGEAIVSAFGW
jgi:proton-translocating NADH-quinone oxidoreductase chain N